MRPSTIIHESWTCGWRAGRNPLAEPPRDKAEADAWLRYMQTFGTKNPAARKLWRDMHARFLRDLEAAAND
ncbi:hypothetical protein EV189_3672 [Motilibacter rhizosphaerae]|uniref:Uncharacterized protein n=1 Tax=Motilibacter rhizosphaerae TaxID=598652 RepID=A0A4Q7NBI4_9ACTN|nr:hypothetical protein EV189_3672 [Motilibacter rhizosphaerae]